MRFPASRLTLLYVTKSIHLLLISICSAIFFVRHILLDEPFNALDKEGQEKLSEIIRDMRDKGSLILLSSHDKDELENLSDVIYLVDSGRFKLK